MIKKNITIFIVFSFVFLLNVNFAQDSTKVKKDLKTQNQQKNNNKNFVDSDGDGYNDNAPDHDGDGIPNSLDADFMKLKKRENDKSVEYVDSDGDGINDNLQFNRKGRKRGSWGTKTNGEMNPQNTNGNGGMDNNKNENGKRKGKL